MTMDRYRLSKRSTENGFTWNEFIKPMAIKFSHKPHLCLWHRRFPGYAHEFGGPPCTCLWHQGFKALWNFKRTQIDRALYRFHATMIIGIKTVLLLSFQLSFILS